MKIRREIKIGIFAIAALACLYFGVNYLKGKDVFSSDRAYWALFDQTGGLRTNAPVLLRGVKVGTVSEIGFDEHNSGKVRVEMSVDKKIAIPVDSHVKLFSSDLMGSKALEIVPGTSMDDNFAEGAVIPSVVEAGILEVASSGLGDLIAEAQTMVRSVGAAVENINGVIDANKGNIAGTMDNIEHFSAVLRANSGRLESIIANLDKVSTDVADADLKTTLNELGASVSHLNTVMAKVSAGEGTAGKLINDTALYDSLTTAAGNLAVLLEDLKANPKRYVHFSLWGAKDKKEKTPKSKK